MGVPYSLEYLGNNPLGDNNKQTSFSEINNRPKFEPSHHHQQDHGLSEEANLAASLEGMMKQFASGLDSAGADFNSADEAANMAAPGGQSKKSSKSKSAKNGKSSNNKESMRKTTPM